jgi:hypothetical protein
MQVSVFHPPDSQFQPEPSGGVPECSTWSVVLSSSHEETKKKISKKKKKEYDICQFSRKVMAHQPADTIATAFHMTSMLVRPTVLLE